VLWLSSVIWTAHLGTSNGGSMQPSANHGPMKCYILWANAIINVAWCRNTVQRTQHHFDLRNIPKRMEVLSHFLFCWNWSIRAIFYCTFCSFLACLPKLHHHALSQVGELNCRNNVTLSFFGTGSSTAPYVMLISPWLGRQSLGWGRTSRWRMI